MDFCCRNGSLLSQWIPASAIGSCFRRNRVYPCECRGGNDWNDCSCAIQNSSILRHSCPDGNLCLFACYFYSKRSWAILPTPTNENYNIWIPASAGMTVYPYGTKDFNSLPVSFPRRRESKRVYM